MVTKHPRSPPRRRSQARAFGASSRRLQAGVQCRPWGPHFPRGELFSGRRSVLVKAPGCSEEGRAPRRPLSCVVVPWPPVGGVRLEPHGRCGRWAGAAVHPRPKLCEPLDRRVDGPAVEEGMCERVERPCAPRGHRGGTLHDPGTRGGIPARPPPPSLGGTPRRPRLGAARRCGPGTAGLMGRARRFRGFPARRPNGLPQPRGAFGRVCTSYLDFLFPVTDAKQRGGAGVSLGAPPSTRAGGAEAPARPASGEG